MNTGEILKRTDENKITKLNKQIKRLEQKLKPGASIFESEEIINEILHIAHYTVIFETDINELISVRTRWIKGEVDIYEEIIESEIFNPEINPKLKGEKLTDDLLFRIAVQIFCYRFSIEDQKCHKDRRSSIEQDLEKLKNMQKEYRRGLFDEVKNTINEYIKKEEDALEDIEIDHNIHEFFHSPYTLNPHLISATRQKNTNFFHMIDIIFGIIEQATKLPNQSIYTLITQICTSQNLGSQDEEIVEQSSGKKRKPLGIDEESIKSRLRKERRIPIDDEPVTDIEDFKKKFHYDLTKKEKIDKQTETLYRELTLSYAPDQQKKIKEVAIGLFKKLITLNKKTPSTALLKSIRTILGQNIPKKI